MVREVIRSYFVAINCFVILSLASFQLRPVRLDQRALERMRQFGRESAAQKSDDRQ
jgi:hypothetical protein